MFIEFSRVAALYHIGHSVFDKESATVLHQHYRVKIIYTVRFPLIFYRPDAPFTPFTKKSVQGNNNNLRQHEHQLTLALKLKCKRGKVKFSVF